MATGNGNGTTTIDRLTEQQDLVLGQARLMLEAAQRESRGFTPDEEKTYAKLLEQHAGFDARIKAAQSDAELLAKVHGLRGAGRGDAPGRGQSVGALFMANSDVAAFFERGGHRASAAWRSPTVDVPYGAMFATTLTEDPTSGGKLVVPQYLPGIVPSPTRPIVVMDLLRAGQTNSNMILYEQETTFTNAAAPTAEGSAKPESALVFDQVSEAVLKIAHWIPVTEELLEDVPAAQSYIDARLQLGVQLAEEDQLLNGNGTPPNFKGLLARATAPTITQSAGESVADAILRQIAAISATAFVRPSGLVMNPSDYTQMLVLKSSTGEYIGPSPFETPMTPMLWGLPVALTPAMPAKTVLAGAFSSFGQFFRRGGLRVEASNSHQDYFIKNLVAIRAEERGALCVYRPSAFGKVLLT
jgi:HK97 family phage major capsid protein